MLSPVPPGLPAPDGPVGLPHQFVVASTCAGVELSTPTVLPAMLLSRAVAVGIALSDGVSSSSWTPLPAPLIVLSVSAPAASAVSPLTETSATPTLLAPLILLAATVALPWDR